MKLLVSKDGIGLGKEGLDDFNFEGCDLKDGYGIGKPTTLS